MVVSVISRSSREVPGSPLGQRLGRLVGRRRRALGSVQFLARGPLHRRLRRVLVDGGAAGGEHDPRDSRPLGGPQHSERSLHGGRDQFLGVLRLAVRGTGWPLHQDVDARHGVVPSGVIEQVHAGEIEAGLGEQRDELIASAIRRDGRLDRVVVLQQFADDVLGDGAGGSVTGRWSWGLLRVGWAEGGMGWEWGQRTLIGRMGSRPGRTPGSTAPR